MFIIREVIDDLYNNFGKWKAKAKTEDGRAELMALYNKHYQGTSLYDQTTYQRACDGYNGLITNRDILMNLVYAPDGGAFNTGPYMYCLFNRLLHQDWDDCPDYTPVTDISLSPNAITLEIGETKQLTASVVPSNATRKDVVWNIQNFFAASVNQDGVVTGISPGTATVYAYSADNDEIFAAAAITVKEPPRPDWIDSVNKGDDAVKVKVKNTTGIQLQSVDLVLAVYNGKTQSTEIKKVSLPALSPGEVSDDIVFDLDYSPLKFKLFLWDGDMKPLGELIRGFN